MVLASHTMLLFVYCKEIRVKLACSRALRALIVLVIALRFAAPAVAAPEQSPIGSIVGTVVDAANGIPLPGVAVTIVGTTFATQTDATGHFAFDAVPVGRHVLSLRRTDYQPGRL